MRPGRPVRSVPEVIFNGPDGRLEGRYQQGPTATAPVGLVLHPHPLYGGTMNNKVVYALYHAFARCGFSVLRFNFRGVGRSQGSYDEGQGELSDAASALDWLQSYNPNSNGCWVAGFSFGAWIAFQLLMRRPEIDAFVAVSTPASMFDFTFLSPCPVSGLMIHGENDELIPEASAAKLANKLTNQRGITVDYQRIPKADHFFRDQLGDVSDRVEAYIRAHKDPAPAA